MKVVKILISLSLWCVSLQGATSYNFLITPNVRDSFREINKEIKMNEGYAFEQIALGGSYAYSLLVEQNPLKIPTDTQEHYLKSLIALTWFFYGQALDKKQPFESGTFLIQDDPQFHIYNFFMDYVKRFGKDINGIALTGPAKGTLLGTIADPALTVSFNPFAYPRESSHYNEAQKKYRQYGIDVRFGKDGNVLPLLPAQKRHILLGIIDAHNYTFILKPEDYGIDYQEGFFQHAKGYVESKARKLGLTEKSDDDRVARRERTPQEFIKDFKAAIQKDATLNNVQKDTFIALANKEGIKVLYTQNLVQRPQFKELVQKYSKEYDHLDLRTGREIILTVSDLYNALTSKK